MLPETIVSPLLPLVVPITNSSALPAALKPVFAMLTIPLDSMRSLSVVLDALSAVVAKVRLVG